MEQENVNMQRKNVSMKDVEYDNKVGSVSSSQRSMWLISQMYNLEPIYNDAFTVHMNENVDVEKIQKCLNKLICRHEILRTTFVMENGIPLQKTNEPFHFPLEIRNFDDLSESEINNIFVQTMKKPFDLMTGPLIRGVLFYSEIKTILFIVSHHIILDGTSVFSIILPELEHLYDGDNLAPVKYQYSDFIDWQTVEIQGLEYQDSLKFWKRNLENLPKLMLPTQFKTIDVSYKGHRLLSTINNEVLGKLKQVSDKMDISLFTLLVSTINLLFHKYTGQKDIVLGTISAGRLYEHAPSIVGNFINPLVLRTNFAPNIKFVDLVEKVNEVTLNAYMNQNVPFDLLVSELNPLRIAGESPLFQVPIVFQPSRPRLTHPWEIRLFDVHAEISKFELSFTFDEFEDHMTFAIEYRTNLFEKEMILQLQSSFMYLLEQIIVNNNQDLKEYQIVTNLEKLRLMNIGKNKTNVELFPIQTIIENQALSTPDNIALECREKKLSYRQLNNYTNQLSYGLLQKGIERNSLIAVYMQRSIEMVIAILGILKAGAAYLPIDPEYPEERISFMLHDSKCKMILKTSNLILTSEHVCINVDDFIFVEGEMNSPNIKYDLEDTAYCIYTSGSTGVPKGSLITHRALSNHMIWMQKTFQFTNNDNILQKTPFSFDASVWEFYAPLICGGKLVMAPPNAHKDVLLLVELLKKYNITVLQLVPSLLEALCFDKSFYTCNTLRYLFAGGESLKMSTVNDVLSNMDLELYNLYGPTETCIDALYWRCTQNSLYDIAPIGRPVDNCEIYILDRNGVPVPEEIVGELYISGAQVSKGYLGNDELTKEKFLYMPELNDGSKLYKTGDLAKWDYKHDAHFCGRVDHQYKLRGFRIEMGEIEKTLRTLPEIHQAEVVINNERTDLCAFIKLSDKLQEGRIREYLSSKLPNYMVPAKYVFLDSMPLLPNGKVDRRYLEQYNISKNDSQPELIPEELQSEEQGLIMSNLLEIFRKVLNQPQMGFYDNFFEFGGDSLMCMMVQSLANREGIEIYAKDIVEHKSVNKLAKYILNSNSDYYVLICNKLLAIWKKVLRVENICLTDNFYNLGGDSLMCMMVQSLANREGINLFAKDIVEYQTIQRLAEYITLVPEKKEYQNTIIYQKEPLTSAQQYVIDISFPDTSHFAMGVYYELPPNIELDKVIQAVNQIIKNHDSLRLEFNTENDIIYQQLQGDKEIVLQHKFINNDSFDLQVEIDRLASEINIFTGETIKGAVLQDGYNNKLLILVIHYLCADGMSWRIIYEDLKNILLKGGGENDCALRESSGFLQWANLIRQQSSSMDPNKWLDMPWEKCIPLKTDLHGRNIMESIDTVYVEMEEDNTRRLLVEATKQYQLPLTSLFQIALAEAFLSVDEYIALDIENFGREVQGVDLDLSNTTGCFTVICPVVLYRGSSLSETIKYIKLQAKNVEVEYFSLAYLGGNSGPYKLLREVNTAQISFNYMGQFDKNTFCFSRSPRGSRHHYIEIDCYVAEGKFIAIWKYSKSIHNRDTISQYSVKFIESLKKLI